MEKTEIIEKEKTDEITFVKMQKNEKEIIIRWRKNKDAIFSLGMFDINCRNITIIYIFICSSNFSLAYWHFQIITEKYSKILLVFYVL